jgi:hypothetical protein
MTAGDGDPEVAAARCCLSFDWLVAYLSSESTFCGTALA